MADNDEDNDSFGEFTFAPTVNSSSQIPATDWGDFSPFQNNAPDHNPNSPFPPPQPQPKWEKFKGALPLSLFGDEEDVDEQPAPAMPVVADDVKQSAFSASGFNNRHKANAQLGINDLIANLYHVEPQQVTKKADNGNELDFSAVNSIESSDPLSKSISVRLNTGSADAAGDQGSDDDDDDE